MSITTIDFTTQNQIATVLAPTGKTVKERTTALLAGAQSTALNLIIAAEGGAKGKIATQQNGDLGIKAAIEQCANQNYTAVIGWVSLTLGTPLPNNRRSYSGLTFLIETELLKQEMSEAKTAAKKVVTLRTLLANITELQAAAEQRYQEIKAADKAAAATLGVAA
jgi:hypothetical protein